MNRKEGEANIPKNAKLGGIAYRRTRNSRFKTVNQARNWDKGNKGNQTEIYPSPAKYKDGDRGACLGNRT
jgi:hypothetical protein